MQLPVNVPVQVQLTPSQSHLTMYSLTLPGSVCVYVCVCVCASCFLHSSVYHETILWIRQNRL